MDTFNIYLDENLNVWYKDDFLSKQSSDILFQYFLQNINFGTPKSRTKILFGNPGLQYTVNFRGNFTTYPVIPWSELPILEQIRDALRNIVGINYNCCVVQKYADGKSIMRKHRDKEMTPGTQICGISLGAQRTFRLTGSGKVYDLKLSSGSLYVLNPPTNDKWLHEIIKDYTSETRISLTFRNYCDRAKR